MKSAWVAVAVVLVANAITIVPAERERAAPVGEFRLVVCRSSLHIGWREDQVSTLQLPLAHRMQGLADVMDDTTLASLGFGGAARRIIGDTVRSSHADWPPPRPAWVALRQQPDSARLLEVVRVAATRTALEPRPGELVMRALIGFDWMWEPVPRTVVDSATRATLANRPSRIGVTVVRLIPSHLGLDRATDRQIEKLRSDDTSESCAVTAELVLGMGRRGALWVQSGE